MLHFGSKRRFGNNKKYIHLEILSEEIGDIKFCHVPLVGDAKINLKNLNKMCRKEGFSFADEDNWIKLLNVKANKNK